MNSLTKNKLIELFYLLMRDATPTGELVRIIRMIDVNCKQPSQFTSEELHSYATRLANELLNVK